MACSSLQKSDHAKNLLTKMFISFSDIYSFILINFLFNFTQQSLCLVCF